MRQQNTISLTLYKNVSSESESICIVKQGRKGTFLSQFLVCIYRLKFDAFSDIDNFVANSKIQVFNIDNLPIIWKMLIYRLSIIFLILSWNFTFNFRTFSVWGCWGQAMSLFWNLVDETQISKSPEPTMNHNLIKWLILLPLLLFTLQYEIPCMHENSLVL